MALPAPSPPALVEPVWRELSRFIRFGPADSAAVLALRDRVRPHFDAIAERFFERVREHDRPTPSSKASSRRAVCGAR